MIIKNSRILAFVLLLSLLLSGTVRATEGNAQLFRPDSEYSRASVDFSVAIGDTLFFCTTSDLFSYKIGENDPTMITTLAMPFQGDEPEFITAADLDWRDRLTCPFAYRGKLNMIHELTGAIMVLEDESFVDTGKKIVLPDIANESDTLANHFVSIFEFESRLYILARTEADDWLSPMELRMVDPATGTHKVIQTQFPILGACAYEPGKLLAFTPSASMAEDDKPLLFVIDGITGKTLEKPVVAADIYWSNPCSPFYDEKTGAIYYVMQNKLLRMKKFSEAPEVMSYFDHQLSQTTSPISMLSGTHLAISEGGATYIRNVQNGPTAITPLKLESSSMPTNATGFMSENPDIAIELVSSTTLSTAGEIAQRIGGGDASVDIFCVRYDSTLRQFMEKGYALDLSGSEMITHAVESMYEPIRDALMIDGKPVGFPTGIGSSLWTYNEARMEELGLTYPTTYFDFLEIYEQWMNEMRYDHPSTYLTPDDVYSASDFKERLIYGILNQYILENGQSGELPVFNTPDFLEILRKLETITDMMEAADKQEGQTYVEENEVLLQRSFDFFNSVSGREGMLSAPAPSIARDSEAIVGLNMGVYIINPNSTNVENAVKFIEYMSEHSGHNTMLGMYPDYNEPLPWPAAKESLEDAERTLAEIKTLEVTDENRRDVEETIHVWEREAELARSMYWRISPEMISRYRKLLQENPPAIISKTFQSGGSTEINHLISRYLQKAISLDQMVRELDQKMRMIYLEQLE